jgi:hypothetical protein
MDCADLAVRAEQDAGRFEQVVAARIDSVDPLRGRRLRCEEGEPADQQCQWGDP